jgi:hypothetical protein
MSVSLLWSWSSKLRKKESGGGSGSSTGGKRGGGGFTKVRVVDGPGTGASESRIEVVFASGRIVRVVGTLTEGETLRRVFEVVERC